MLHIYKYIHHALSICHILKCAFPFLVVLHRFIKTNVMIVKILLKSSAVNKCIYIYIYIYIRYQGGLGVSTHSKSSSASSSTIYIYIYIYIYRLYCIVKRVLDG